MMSTELGLHKLFKRCVECPTEQLICPVCPTGEICSLVPQSCGNCSYMTCIPDPSADLVPSSSPNVGAIAGGVIGGVAFVLLVMALVWRFSIKHRRAEQELEADEAEEDDVVETKHGARQFTRSSDAASTRTRASFASTILSRASNYIPIAYIPGVTNRSGSGHNSLLANVPVPPIPAAYANSASRSPLSNQGDELFFAPSDLRGSTYSATSSIDSHRRDTQYTHKSMTPSLARSSMISYRDDATVEPMPTTTTFMRGAPRMVSVKSSQASSPTNSMTSGTQFKLMVPGQGLTTTPRSLSGGSFVKPTQGNLRSKGRFPVRQASDASTAPSSILVPTVSSPLIEVRTESESDEEEHARGLLSDSGSATSTATSTPLIQPIESPFFDASELPLSDSPPPTIPINRPNPYAAMSSTVGTSQDPRARRAGDRPMGGLSAVIEEASKHASRPPNRNLASSNKQSLSPFSDEFATL